MSPSVHRIANVRVSPNVQLAVTPSGLTPGIIRLTELIAGGEEMDWPSLINAAADEIEDLRAIKAELPSPLVRWVRSVIGR